MTTVDRIETVREALAQIVGKTIANVTVSDNGEDADTFRNIMEIVATDGTTVRVHTQDAEDYSSWFAIGDDAKCS